MRKITESIVKSFLASNKKHLVITGSIGSGKSAFVNEIVENLFPGVNIPGITTHLVNGKEVILRESGKDAYALIGKFENGMRPVEEGFSKLGVEALRRAVDAEFEWALIDEIGFLESNHEAFQEAVRLLFSKKRVIAVTRKQEIPFLQELRGREDAFVLDVDELHKKVGCVIMASGLGIRFGENKLLAKFKNKMLIEHILESTNDLFAKRVVVTRTKEVRDYCEKKDIPVIYHEYPYRNDVVRLGIGEMQEMDGCIFCPCDQPLLTRTSLRKLRNTFSFEEKEILRLSYGDKQGTPILFDKKFFVELSELPEKKGGSFVVKKYPSKVSLIFAESEKELYDIDTKADLAKLEELSAND